MRLSKDAKVLIVLVTAFVVGFSFIAQSNVSDLDSPSSYSTGKRGTKALYMLLEGLGFRTDRYTDPLKSIPRDVHVLFVVDAKLDAADGKALANWVRKGNTLILATSYPWAIPNEFEVDATSVRDAESKSERPMTGEYTRGVSKVKVAPALNVVTANDIKVIVKTADDVVVAEQPLSRGRIILFGDPLMLANSGIRNEDNVVLITNMVYANAGAGGRVLFAEYDQILSKKDVSVLSVIGRGGQLALGVVCLVALITALSCSRRFGTIHPLKEKEDRPRGWEFVRATAGLYRRAQAREASVGSVYRSFRRELATTFGVNPSTDPQLAAEMILKARQIDKARVAAVMQKCELVLKGHNLTDHEAFLILRTIEECRRELGIARTEGD